MSAPQTSCPAALSAYELAELSHVARNPTPTCSLSPRVVDRLTRQGLAEVVSLPSPFRSHNGRRIPHLKATEAGRVRAGLSAEAGRQ
jgi:hypothetical protein